MNSSTSLGAYRMLCLENIFGLKFLIVLLKLGLKNFEPIWPKMWFGLLIHSFSMPNPSDEIMLMLKRDLKSRNSKLMPLCMFLSKKSSSTLPTPRRGWPIISHHKTADDRESWRNSLSKCLTHFSGFWQLKWIERTCKLQRTHRPCTCHVLQKNAERGQSYLPGMSTQVA